MSIVRNHFTPNFQKQFATIQRLSSCVGYQNGIEKASSFFDKVIDFFDLPLDSRNASTQFIAVLPGFYPSTPFLYALSKLGKVTVIRKNSTSHFTRSYRVWQELGCNIDKNASKHGLAKPDKALAFLTQDVFAQKNTIILDHGGYFAATAPLLKEELKGSLRGIVEYADNGIFKYLKHQKDDLPPVISTAASPLKAGADFAAGEAITFALDHLLRESFSRRLCDYTNIGVIGYGRLGSSIIDNLKSSSVSQLFVHDIDPCKMILSSVKHALPSSLEALLAKSDLIISASGTGQALKPHHYSMLKDKACLATVTSPDDELDLHTLIREKVLIPQENVGHFKAYATGNKTIYLALNGESPNTFMQSGITHPSIYLPFAEYLSAGGLLATGQQYPAGVSELSSHNREAIAHIWLDHFYRA